MRAVGENVSWDRIFRELMLPDQTDKVKKVAAEYLRPRVKGVATEVGLLDNLRTVTATIRQAGIQVFIVPHRR